ncbi:MAG TPA: hypothetical protein VF326_05820 [Anaerolineaceae bacterium]
MLAFLLLTSIGLQLINPQIMRSFIDIAQNRGRRIITCATHWSTPPTWL